MRVSPVQGVRSLPSAQLQKTTDERRRQARLTGFVPHETYLESHDDADDDGADGDGDGDGDGDDGDGDGDGDGEGDGDKDDFEHDL